MAGIVNRLRSGRLSSVELTEQCLEADRAARRRAAGGDGHRRPRARAGARRRRGARPAAASPAPVSRWRSRTTSTRPASGRRPGPPSWPTASRARTPRSSSGWTRPGCARREGAAARARLRAGRHRTHFGPCRNPWDPERIPGGRRQVGRRGGRGDVRGRARDRHRRLGQDPGGAQRASAGSGRRRARSRTAARLADPLLRHDRAAREGGRGRGRRVRGPCRLRPAGTDLRPRVSGRPLAELETGIEELRIGPPASFYFDDADEPVVAAVRAAGDALMAWAPTSSRWSCPARRGARGGDEDHLGRGAGHAPGSPRRRAGSFGEDVRRRLPSGEESRAPTSPNAVQTGREWRRMLDGVFEEVDAILSPVSERGRAARGRLRDDRDDAEAHHPYLRLVAGRHPGAGRPCGFSPEGMPISLRSPRLRGESRRSSGSAPPTSARPTGTCASRRS